MLKSLQMLWMSEVVARTYGQSQGLKPLILHPYKASRTSLVGFLERCLAIFPFIFKGLGLPQARSSKQVPDYIAKNH